MAIEIRQTKRTVVYRAVVTKDGESGATVAKTFRSRAAAVAWEREMLAAAASAPEAARATDTSA